jgi:hypothetical protein
MKKSNIALFCLFLFSFLCGFGNAILQSQNLSELTIGSDAIIYGKIVDVKSLWNPQKTHIVTTAQVKVNDVFYSSDKSIVPGSTISVSVLGGTVGNDTEWVEDTPVFIPNVEVILFLKKTENENYTVYGHTPGLVTVINGTIRYSKPGTSQAGIDIDKYKQDIQSILQNAGIQKTTTTSPAPTMTTETIPATPKAPVVFAPVISVIAVIFLLRKHG